MTRICSAGCAKHDDIMKKYIYSLIFVVIVAVFSVGTTIAFFVDSETSTDNTFDAGALDIKIDSEAHYRGLVCVDGFWTNPELIDCEKTSIVETLAEVESMKDSGVKKNCEDFGYDYTIAKWNIVDGVFIPEDGANGTTVEGDGIKADWTSETEVAMVIRKASTNYTLLTGGYSGIVYEYCIMDEEYKCHDISHIEFCGNYDPVCGNGIVEPGEECDDGNLVNGDGCDNECQYECAISGAAEDTPVKATMDNGSIATEAVAKSDDIYASQNVDGTKYIYLDWEFSGLPVDVPLVLATLSLEHKEYDAGIEVEWWDGVDWTPVCDPPERSRDRVDTCDLLAFIDNTDNASEIKIRLKLTPDGSCHEYLDWASIKLIWYQDIECGDCGNCILEDGEECDNSLNVSEGFYCTDDCKLVPQDPCEGTWEEIDLEYGVHKFFSFSSIKPGDYGEDTISLHVYDNDSWGRLVINNINNSENTCTLPEFFDEEFCDDNEIGELGKKILFYAWLDDGEIPGFQNTGLEEDDEWYDHEEGDNIKQDIEILFRDTEVLNNNGEEWDLTPVLAQAYSDHCDTGFPLDGGNNNGICHGLSLDGRLVGSTLR